MHTETQSTNKNQTQEYGQFELEIAAMLTKAELIFDLSKVLEDCYYYSEKYEENGEEKFTINLKQSDGRVIARCLRKYKKNNAHKYYWQPVEVKEQKIEQSNTPTKEQHQIKNTCPPGVVNVLVKTAIFFDLAKLLQSELSIKSESYMFEVEYDNKMMGVSTVYCPCFPGVTWCCG